MARLFARILSDIWDDEDFLALSDGAQRMYMFVLSQRKLNHAGLLSLAVRKWARKASNLTAEYLTEQLVELNRTRFIVLDVDTEELLVRTLVRNDNIYKQPRVMGAMVSDAREIESPKLRRALLAEVDRIPLDELSDEPGKNNTPSIRAQVAGHIDDLRAALAPPRSPQPPREPLDDDLREPPGDGDGEPPGDPLGEDLHEVGRQASTRVHASPHARAFPVSPTPGPLPSPFTAPAAPGAVAPAHCVQLSLVPDLVGSEPASASATVVDDAPERAATAQTLINEWLSHRPKRPPGAVIARVGKALKVMLDEGIDPSDVRAGLAAWHCKNLGPAALPGVVDEVMNAPAAIASQVQSALSRPSSPRVSATARALAEVAAAGEEAKRLIYGSA